MDRPYMSFPRVTKFGYANDEDSQGPRWKRVQTRVAVFGGKGGSRSRGQ